MSPETMSPPSKSRSRLIMGGIANAILAPSTVFLFVLVRLLAFDQHTSFAGGLAIGAAISAVAAMVACGPNQTLGSRLLLVVAFALSGLLAAPFIAFVIWQLVFGGYFPGA